MTLAALWAGFCALPAMRAMLHVRAPQALLVPIPLPTRPR